MLPILLFIVSVRSVADEATAQLDLAMHELYSWRLPNKLTPHPGKSEAIKGISQQQKESYRGLFLRSLSEDTLSNGYPNHAYWG